ncbi:serine hydrolase domain-containing protein [Pontibacter sp. G13]|uniref:serine hydrolase domain-containing protein n=1 Tax=Pontibacter sp. G13 TaxID=3074898 RepID=UPI00288AE88A|nr:serine hydrolase domain-containing protein [Pontibacter sp. G13]WNJ20324.1 serine hydrolase domain-containing protein [Pontibacter sp. G13]
MNRIFTFYLSITAVVLGLVGCQSNEVVPVSTYQCQFDVADSSDMHPRAATYQEILDRNQKLGIVGATLMVKDEFGVWVGAAGTADIASDVPMQPCNSFLIASISKVFTAAAVFAYIDAGVLSLDDPVSKWMDEEVVKRIENADEAQIRHLLDHTSGIADYYTLSQGMQRFNQFDNGWTQEDVLAFTYGKSAWFEVGETYGYSNTNYVMLGIILEAASGKTLEEVYRDEIFNPLHLTSAYYSATEPIPASLVKGYADFYGTAQYVESEFLYKDELVTADGGIAIHAQDLGRFFEELMKGELVSETALDSMTSWFDLPEDWVDETIGHAQNGYGLERNQTPYGWSVGHTGAIDGFLSIAQYFPDTDRTFILLTNSAAYDGAPRENIYNETLKVMFE